ncbi:hypothetical protein KJ853_03570 [Patescibacteria group bacterium]|nr:hypothetical protein [Patescibacteria group bacterium]
MAEQIKNENYSEKPKVKIKKGPYKPYTWSGIDADGKISERASHEEILFEGEKENDRIQKESEQIADVITSEAFGLNKKPEAIKEIKQKLNEGQLISSAEAAALREDELLRERKSEKAEIQELTEAEKNKEKIAPVPPAHLPVERPPARIIPRQEAVAVKKTTEPVTEAEKKTPEEVEAARQAAAKEMTKEEQIGELEHNLKYRYIESFNELKNKKEPVKEIYDNIQKDQGELAQLYEPEMRAKVIKIYDAIKESFRGKDEKINELIKTEAGDFEMRLDSYKKLVKGRKAEQVKKDEIFRGELGEVFNKIKWEAMEETGYKSRGAKERKTKGKMVEKTQKEDQIIKGEKLLKEYNIESIEQLEELKKIWLENK